MVILDVIGGIALVTAFVSLLVCVAYLPIMLSAKVFLVTAAIAWACMQLAD